MANIHPPPPRIEESVFSKPPQNGACFFSTRNGRFPPRYALSGMPLIIRSNPVDDCEQKVTELQRDFPEICMKIKESVTYETLYEWFDHRDAHAHGAGFLLSVLSYIARDNQRRLYDYVKRWRATNAQAFMMIVPEHAVEHIFTPEDREEYDHGFLTDAMVEIKRMQAIEKEQQLSQLQEQHAQMIKDQREFVVSQASATGPGVPVHVPRATSNPERPSFQHHPGHTRQIPPPGGHFAVPTNCLPLPRLTGATELLEHIAPGATSRGDFHSDPLATLERPYPKAFTAIPSRGAPGPYSYTSGRPVPLHERQRNFSGNAPRGRKNPMKKASDDARRQFEMETGYRSLPNRGTLRQYPALASPLWSPGNTQVLHSPATSTSQVQNVSHSGYRHNNEHQSCQHPPRVEDLAAHIFTTGPHHPPTASRDPNEDLAFFPRPESVRFQGGIKYPQYTPRNSNPEFDGKRFVLATVSNSGPRQWQQPLEPRRSVSQTEILEGDNKIWIGAIPIDFTKKTMMRLLEPCRGLIDITDLKLRPSGTLAYVFAHFVDPNCALEALERIPQTQFDMLPNGQRLVTNWPKQTSYPRGEYKDRRTIGPSPTKSRKDSNTEGHHNRISLTNSENRILVAGGSPSSSRKAVEGEGRQSCGLVAGSDDRHRTSRKSHSPAGRAAIAVPRNTNCAFPVQPNTTAVEIKAVAKVESTTQPINTLSEADTSAQHKNSKMHTDTSANFVTHRFKDNDESISNLSEAKAHALSGKAPGPSTLSSVDGIQETIPPSKTKQSNKKKNKPKSSNKAAVLENKSVPTPPAPPVSGRTDLPTPAKPNSATLGAKALVKKEVKGLQDDSYHNTPKTSSTTVPPDPNLVTRKDPAVLRAPASPAQDTGSSHSDKPMASPNSSKSGPSNDLDSNASNQGKVPITRPQAPIPVAPAMPSALDQEPRSQAMTRDTSTAAEYNTLAEKMSTAPTSFYPSERSNSIADDSQYPPPKVHTSSLVQAKPNSPGIDPYQLRNKLETEAAAAKFLQANEEPAKAEGPAAPLKSGASKATQTKLSGATALDQKSKRSDRPASLETSNVAKNHVRGPQHVGGDDIHHTKTEENPLKKASTEAISPKSPSSIRTPTMSQSSERKQAPEIPQRSSSLSVSSTPIHTRLKKKTKTFAPMAEDESGGGFTKTGPGEALSEIPESGQASQYFDKVTPAKCSPSTQGCKTRSNRKKRSNKPDDNQTTVVAPTSPTPSSKKAPLPEPEMPFELDDENCIAVSTPNTAGQALPESEKPFCTDNGVSLPVPKLGGPTKIMPDPVDDYYKNKAPYELMAFRGCSVIRGRSAPSASSASDNEDIETATREAGYQEPSSSRHLAPQNSDIAMCQNMFDFANVGEKAIAEANSSLPPKATPEEDLIKRLASGLSPQGLSWKSNKTYSDKPSSPDTESYNTRLLSQIKEILARKKEKEASSIDDSPVILRTQEYMWGECLSLYLFPGSESLMGPEKWAFWAADFVHPSSVGVSTHIRELKDNIKFLVGKLARLYSFLKLCETDTSTSDLRFKAGNSSTIRQELKAGIKLLELMPGSPWAEINKKEWKIAAVLFRRYMMAKLDVTFPKSLREFDNDPSMAISPTAKFKSTQGSTSPCQHIVRSILDTLARRLGEVHQEIVRPGSRTSALEAKHKLLMHLVENSPVILTSQTDPKEWGRVATKIMNDMAGQPFRTTPANSDSAGKVKAMLSPDRYHSRTSGSEMFKANLLGATTERPPQITPAKPNFTGQSKAETLTYCHTSATNGNSGNYVATVGELLLKADRILHKEKERGFDPPESRRRHQKIRSVFERAPNAAESIIIREKWVEETKQLFNEFAGDRLDDSSPGTLVPESSPKSDEVRVITPPSPATLGRSSPSEEPARFPSSLAPPVNCKQCLLEELFVSVVDEMIASKDPAVLELLKISPQQLDQRDKVEFLQQKCKHPKNRERPECRITRGQTQGMDDEDFSSYDEIVIEVPGLEVHILNPATAEKGINEHTKPHIVHTAERITDHNADTKPKARNNEQPKDQKHIETENTERLPLTQIVILPHDQATDASIVSTDGQREGKQSTRVDQITIDEEYQSDEQTKQGGDICEKTAESTDTKKDSTATTEHPEQPTHEREGRASLSSEASDAKGDNETEDVFKGPATAQELTEKSTYEGEVLTSPSLGPQSTPPSSEAHSSPTGWEVHDVKDDGKNLSTASYEEKSPLKDKGGSVLSKGGKKSYAALAKESAGGVGGEKGKKDGGKDPWAVPAGEPTWGVGKG